MVKTRNFVYRDIHILYTVIARLNRKIPLYISPFSMDQELHTTLFC